MTVGLRPGFSIDMGTLKPDGTPWNLENDKDYRVLKAWRNEEKPVLLCGSPPCNAFSKIQTWNRSRMKPGTEKELKRTGRLHLTRCVELYRAQMRDGLFFLHEFPKGSSSVQEECLEDLLRTPGVFLIEGPMCFWGMTSSDHEGEGLVKKQTCWVTNSEFIAYELDRECTNKTGCKPWLAPPRALNQP